MTTKAQKKPLASTPTGYPNGHNPNSLVNLAKGRAKLAEMRKNGELTNPGGYSLRSELKQALKDRRRELLENTIQGAIDLMPTPFHEVWDRVDGKLNDKPVTPNVNVVFVIGRGYANQPLLKEGEE